MLPKFNILYAAQNPNGVYLDVVLQQIKDDITTKNSLLSDLSDGVSQNYHKSNMAIIELLEQAMAKQAQAMEFDKLNSDTKRYINLTGAIIEACPMTYHEYLSFVGRKVFGDNPEGYYVTHDRGTPYMSVCWVCNEMLHKNYTLLD